MSGCGSKVLNVVVNPTSAIVLLAGAGEVFLGVSHLLHGHPLYRYAAMAGTAVVAAAAIAFANKKELVAPTLFASILSAGFGAGALELFAITKTSLHPGIWAASIAIGCVFGAFATLAAYKVDWFKGGFCSKVSSCFSSCASSNGARAERIVYSTHEYRPL